MATAKTTAVTTRPRTSTTSGLVAPTYIAAGTTASGRSRSPRRRRSPDRCRPRPRSQRRRRRGPPPPSARAIQSSGPRLAASARSMRHHVCATSDHRRLMPIALTMTGSRGWAARTARRRRAPPGPGSRRGGASVSARVRRDRERQAQPCRQRDQDGREVLARRRRRQHRAGDEAGATDASSAPLTARPPAGQQSDPLTDTASADRRQRHQDRIGDHGARPGRVRGPG